MYIYGWMGGWVHGCMSLDEWMDGWVGGWVPCGCCFFVCFGVGAITLALALGGCVYEAKRVSIVFHRLLVGRWHHPRWTETDKHTHPLPLFIHS
jgi:hypothetical protein